MIFKVDFAKAYDSVRWDFLDDVLSSFGFGSRWRSWVRGSLSSGKASILVNGSPTSDFSFFLVDNMSSNKPPWDEIDAKNEKKRVIEKIAWVKWSKVLASKKFGGLEYSSYFALNRLFSSNGFWRSLSRDNSLWSRVFCLLHGFEWGTLYQALWYDLWIGDSMLKLSFPRLFALEENKVISVADKLHSSISSSFRRPVRGGEEAQQLDH
ncbi:hypothetical protein Tco_0491583 [Tanacetum coccineum]